MLDHINGTMHGDNDCITTGYREFDYYLGGFHGGDMIVLASRPGVGKSTLALNIAAEVARITGGDVLFFTPEMTAVSLSERYISNRADIAIDRLRAGAFGETEWGRISDAADRENKPLIHIDDDFHASLSSIEIACRRYKPTLVIIDSFDLLEYDPRHVCAVTAARELSKGIKGIAKDFNIPILVLTQLDKTVERRADKTPKLSDLRYPGALEDNAGAVLLLHRPAYCDPDCDGREARLIIAKNRHGSAGSVPLIWQPQYFRFIPCQINDAE